MLEGTSVGKSEKTVQVPTGRLVLVRILKMLGNLYYLSVLTGELIIEQGITTM